MRYVGLMLCLFLTADHHFQLFAICDVAEVRCNDKLEVKIYIDVISDQELQTVINRMCNQGIQRCLLLAGRDFKSSPIE